MKFICGNGFRMGLNLPQSCICMVIEEAVACNSVTLISVSIISCTTCNKRKLNNRNMCIMKYSWTAEHNICDLSCYWTAYFGFIPKSETSLEVSDWLEAHCINTTVRVLQGKNTNKISEVTCVTHWVWFRSCSQEFCEISDLVCGKWHNYVNTLGKYMLHFSHFIKMFISAWFFIHFNIRKEHQHELMLPMTNCWTESLMNKLLVNLGS